jgi:hypothetical protein
MDVSPFRDIGSQTKLKNRPAAKIQKARKLKINSEARKPGTWEKLRFQIRLFLVSWFPNYNFRDQFRKQEARNEACGTMPSGGTSFRSSSPGLFRISSFRFGICFEFRDSNFEFFFFLVFEKDRPITAIEKLVSAAAKKNLPAARATISTRDQQTGAALLRCRR